MVRREGYYGIIQYCPNIDRSEGANVGVYLFCRSMNVAMVRMSEGNDRVRKYFGTAAFDVRRLTADKQALRRRLEALGAVGLDEIAAFISKEAGGLLVGMPRPIAVTDSKSDLDFLFDEMVGELQKPKRDRVRVPDISDVFEPLRMGVPLRTNLTIMVPSLHQRLHIPYAYRNESVNYIKPHGFSSKQDAAMQSASHLGVQGLMLHNHPIIENGEKVEQQLVVVAEFASSKVRANVVDILKEFPVRLIPANDVRSFAEEVRLNAKRLPPAAE